MGIILEFNWVSIFVSFFTCCLVIKDRAFSSKIRGMFHISIAFCLFLSISGHLSNYFFCNGSLNSVDFIQNVELFLHPVILLLLVLAADSFNKTFNRLIIIPALINIFFVGFNIYWGCLLVSAFYTILVCISIVFAKKNNDIFDCFFAGIMFFMLAASFGVEIFISGKNITNDALCVFSSVFYYYWVLRIYKKDGLTGLLMRHNLNFEMQDLRHKDYNIVLIDVDNFKLINDKYGHDKGDEALITVVKTIQSNLVKGCRLYRFGGDEFVIISQKASKDELSAVLDKANNQLAESDLHISYGIVQHKKNVDSAVSLVEADKVMYENKRLLKSEDIWDDMTGLYNYRGFLDEMETFRKAVNKDDNSVCLIAVDVEHLNSINMAYGYTEGNIVISVLARVLKTCLHGRDFIGHLGSDEFVVAVECKAADDDSINAFIRSIYDTIDSAFELTDKDYTVKLNIAKYVIDIDSDLTSDDCINNVLYLKQEDKDNRRKNNSADDEEDYNNQEEQLVLDILDNNKLKYAFQPIVSAKDGSIVAYESLMRSDTDTMVSPLKIIKYAERNKRAYDVERYTFFNVLSKVTKLSNFPDDRRIFINSMPGYFLKDADYEYLKGLYGDFFSRLVIEITEQREINEDALVSINQKRDRDAFNIAIDDYGSGCSNTNSLLRYMPQVVKLDRLLITGIDRNAKKQFFVNSIIAFARENDMKILAEGVETESELKTVIRLGADMIQGYFTAKPSFEIIDEIPADIKKLIVDEHLKVGSNQRKVFTVSKNCSLSMVNLTMEDYSKINISTKFVTITGSPEYTADMVIRIKDGVTTHLTLSDVKLNSVDDEPCIDIGENAHLTLNIEGNNRLNAKGIHVPESSSLKVIGPGNIEIFVKGHKCYAIGADYESGFGNLEFRNSGTIVFNVDGEECVGIGGGNAVANSKIAINAGRFEMNVAGVNAVGFGCFNGDISIDITDAEICSAFRVNTGTVIGTINGKQNINIKNYNIDIKGSGAELSGIGSFKESSGDIEMHSGTHKIKLNGHKIFLLGCDAGNIETHISHSRLDMTGEGDNVVGFGSLDKTSYVAIDDSSMELVINASDPLAFGVSENDFIFKGPLAIVKVNGVLQEI